MPYTLSNQPDSELMNSCMLKVWSSVIKFYIENSRFKTVMENNNGTYTVRPNIFARIKNTIVHFDLFEIRERTGSQYGRSGYDITDRRYDLIEQCLQVARTLYICDGDEPTIQEHRAHSDYTRAIQRFF